MLVFIIPLKSAKVSDSWERVSQLFERTIRSVCNQTSSEFQVIVVGHEKPDIEFHHPNVTYLSVDFPPPTWENNKDYRSRRLDKQKKIFLGLNYARQFNPTHVMFVDADDCVSKYLAEFVSHNSDAQGWIFETGYEFVNGSKSILLRKKGFNHRCGTSSIVKYDLVAPDKNLKIVDIYPMWLFHGGFIKRQLQDKGYCLEILPFPGAVYITDNGSNIYTQQQMRLQRARSIYKKLRVFLVIAGKRVLSRPLTDSIREEFGLYDIDNLNLANEKQLVAKSTA